MMSLSYIASRTLFTKQVAATPGGMTPIKSEEETELIASYPTCIPKSVKRVVDE
jgi:hypothetical protein